MRYKRVLLKMSGEAMLGFDEKNPKFPYDPEVFGVTAAEICEARKEDIQIAVVMGGGNIGRGEQMVKKEGMDRVEADWFGMLATLQNGIVLRELLSREFKVPTRLMSGLTIPQVAEPYLVLKARSHLERGAVVILAGGTGNGYCTTDYAAALRASELKAELIAMAKNVDGVYDKDPKKHADAKFLTQVSYDRARREELKVMDGSAFDLCRDQNIPIRVFSLKERGNIAAVLKGNSTIGTLVSSLPDPV